MLGTEVYAVFMSQIEEHQCPRCQASVKTSGAPEVSERSTSMTGAQEGESYSTAYTSEMTNCPSCGAHLERPVTPGAPWRLAD